MKAEQLDVLERMARGEMLGWGVWRHLCERAGRDPKDLRYEREQLAVVEAVRDAFVAFDGGGFDGLAEWLELEHLLSGSSESSSPTSAELKPDHPRTAKTGA